MSPHSVRHSAVLVTLCLAMSVSQAQTIVRLRLTAERLSKDVPVSGRQLVGAMVAPAAVAAGALSTDLLLSWRALDAQEPTGRLCITYVSRDGVYFAQGELETSSLPPQTGLVQVRGEHDARAVDLLRALPADQLAVLARSGACRGTGSTTKVFVTDRVPAAGPRPTAVVNGRSRVWLMLNAQGQTLTTETMAGSEVSQPGACRALDGGDRNKSFDTICEIDLPQRPQGAQVKIHRRVYERALDPITVDLSWTAG